jgi:hypothetical protein
VNIGLIEYDQDETCMLHHLTAHSQCCSTATHALLA